MERHQHQESWLASDAREGFIFAQQDQDIASLEPAK
jgi:hypothetical protein